MNIRPHIESRCARLDSIASTHKDDIVLWPKRSIGTCKIDTKYINWQHHHKKNHKLPINVFVVHFHDDHCYHYYCIFLPSHVQNITIKPLIHSPISLFFFVSRFLLSKKTEQHPNQFLLNIKSYITGETKYTHKKQNYSLWS